MAGHRNFDELRRELPPERVARNHAVVRSGLEKMLLRDMRALGDASEVHSVADTGDSQFDAQVSTVRRLVESLGGELEIVAKLPGRQIAVRLPANVSAK